MESNTAPGQPEDYRTAFETDLGSTIQKLEAERAGLKERREALATESRGIDEKIAWLNATVTRMNATLTDIRKGVDSPPAGAPVRRRRRRRGKVSAKDAIYGAIESLEGRGAKASELRERAARESNREVSASAASNALWTLGKEGRIRREGFLWYLAGPGTEENAEAE